MLIFGRLLAQQGPYDSMMPPTAARCELPRFTGVPRGFILGTPRD
jgi:hypothetical protein